jgi:parvulin-like peptidyl-prolyl isomerase
MRSIAYACAAIGLTALLVGCRQLDLPKSDHKPEPTTPQTAAPAAPTAATLASGTISATVPVTTTVPAASSEGAAATVNGAAVAMDAFRKQALDTQRFYVERGLDPNTDQGQQELLRLRRQVLDDMINQVLIEQAAKEMGITVGDSEVDASLAKSIEASGGAEKFQASLVEANATMDDVRQMERASLIGRKVQEQVTADVPTTAEAVRARHILCETEAACQAALARLQNGEDFAAVAKAVSTDKATAERGGDLDWVVRGLLPSRQVEDALFAVAAGQRSAVVKTDFGYHVIEVLERDPARALSADQLIELKQRRLAEWLRARRDKAAVVINVAELRDLPPSN